MSTFLFHFFCKNNWLSYFFLIAFFSSCSTYKATVRDSRNLKYDAIRVTPEWTYKEPKKKKWIMPVIGLTAAAAYGYTQTTIIDDEIYTGYENAAIWGAGGLVVGGLFNSIVFQRRNPRKTRFDISQSEKWIKSYNKTTKSEFTITQKEVNNRLVLVPTATLNELRESLSFLNYDLKKSPPNISFQTLQLWKSKLNGKYSILPVSEITAIEKSIEFNEKKIADKDLLSKANTFKSLSEEYPTIRKILGFKRSATSLYNAASFETRQSADDIMDNKLASVFEKLMGEEFEELKKIPQNLEYINKYDIFYSAFDSKYKTHRDRPEVQHIYSLITQKKSLAIAQYADAISKNIKETEQQNELTVMENKYFKYVDTKEQTILELASQLRNRRFELRAERERRNLVEKKKKEKLREERRVAMNNMTLKERDIFLNELDLVTEGLENEDLIKAFYLGNFDDIIFDRDEMTFISFLDTYITAYAQFCASSLPANKIELTKQECDTWSVTKNGWGVEVSRYCISYRTVSLGLYSKPEMYQAKVNVNNLYRRNVLGDVFDLLTAKNPYAAITDMTYEAISFKYDLENLIRIHGCEHPALIRLEENLRAFANNNNPKQIYISKTKKEDQPFIVSKHQNYGRLIDDLIYSNSRKWAMNKYHKGSASNLVKRGEDELGRPTEITAQYRFNGWQGNETGSVRVTFEDGIPKCIYFFDFPNDCKTANRKIISEYKKGLYQN